MENTLRILILVNDMDAGLIKHEFAKQRVYCHCLRVESRSDFIYQIGEFIPDAVIIDNAVAPFDVSQALQLLRQEKSKALVILLIDDLSIEMAITYIKQGMDGYLARSELKMLPLTIMEMFNYRELRRKMRTTARLRIAEEKYRTVVEGALVGVFVLEMGGKFLYVNPRLAEMLGYQQAELLTTKKAINLIAPESKRVLLRQIAEFSRQKSKRFHLFGIAIHRQGQRIPLEIFANHTGLYGRAAIIGTVLDISERKQTENEIVRAKEKFQALFDNASDSIFIHDLQGRFLEVNQETCRRLGYSREELLQLSATAISAVQYSNLFAERVGIIQQHGHLVCEDICRTRDGDTFPVELSCRLIDYEEQPAILGIARDVSKRKCIEQELVTSKRKLQETLDHLKVTQKQIIQNERLRALGQMASGIAHDFNNALTPILGFTELLLMRPGYLEDQGKLRKYLTSIKTLAEDAANIVSRLREFYRQRGSEDEIKLVDINKLIAHVIDLTQPKWKDQAQAAGITIKIFTQLQSLPKIPCNEAEIREVLTNLIFNAVDAMPQGGSITLRTRRQDIYALIEITDTGIGMTDEARKHCLEPFYSTKGRHGSGLGLSLCYGIIARHQGKIEINSTPGKGSTFALRLLTQRTAAKETMRIVLDMSEQKKLRILIVDDEEQVRELLREYLQIDQHRVTIAGSGQEALEQFVPGDFDLVITDKAMPVMNGEQLALSLKQLQKDIPIMMLTGFGDIMKSKSEKPVGIDYLASKPLSLQKLRQAIFKTLMKAAPETLE